MFSPLREWTMKTLISGAVFLALAMPVSAQVMDDSGGQTSDALARNMSLALVGKTFDPFSALFIQIKQKGDDICGQVNLKNQMGAYTGFSPFLFSGGQMFLNQTTPC